MNLAFAFPLPATSVSTRRSAPDGRRLLFLDIEASSLAPHSWPVEIGWAWLADAATGGRAVEQRSAVVAPRPTWCASAWSEAAVTLHGLTLERVRRGLDADTVAAMTDAFAGSLVVSDNPRWDQVWLDRLREGRPRIEILPLRRLRAALDPDAASAFALSLLRRPSPHRAGPDAARLALAWAEATA